MHSCIFCDRSYPTLEELASHLVCLHPDATVLIGGRKARFHVYSVSEFVPQEGTYVRGPNRKLHCICGQRFDCTRSIAPLFMAWAHKNLAELDSFVAHLRRQGGIKEHLEKLQLAANLERVEGRPPEEVYYG